MKIVVVGAGKVGTALCQDLSREGHDITLIEHDPLKLQTLVDKFDLLGILGNGSFYDVQMEADTEHADMFIAVTPEDEVNIIACVIAKKIGAKETIARVREPEHASHMQFVRDSMGITMMINPELEAAREIYRMLQFPSALSIEPFVNNRANLVELVIEDNSHLANVKLTSFRQRFKDLLVCMIVRQDETMIPDGNTVLQAGDHIFVTGKPHDLDELYKSAGDVERIKSILIVGGGRITYYLLDMLKNLNHHIKVIESKQIVATDLAVAFPHASIIFGDGTDQALLSEHSIGNYDAVVTLTGIDEENIILSMFAASKGVRKTITKINRTSILDILTDSSVQRVITPANIMATSIVRVVRAFQNSAGSSVEALFRLPHNQAEVLQFFVRSSSKVCGVTLAQMPLQPNTLIAFILRGSQLIFPSGQDQIYAGDHVVIVTTNVEYDDVDDILR